MEARDSSEALEPIKRHGVTYRKIAILALLCLNNGFRILTAALYGCETWPLSLKR
jgi:hypothetical protein